MSGDMTKITVPTPGRNKLTERLLAQGVKLDDPATWPENVWLGEENNFAYKREWRFTPTWESPCGLLIHRHGDFWGDTWALGEHHCAENDNPLFGCPIPGRPCEHRLKLPAGINCCFHRTDKEWRKEISVEELERLAAERWQELREEELEKYPGWKGDCACLRREYLPDGSVRLRRQWRLEKCLGMSGGRCESTQCVCRLGAPRDLSRVNIFYDLYVERDYTVGMVPCHDAQLRKGLKVFERAICRTDAELALKIWRHDPDSALLPPQMGRLNVERNLNSREVFFIRHHGRYGDRTECTLRAEVRAIRVARAETRDLMEDLRQIRDGVEVVHESDLKKAAEVKDREKREAYRLRKAARRLAAEWQRGEKNGAFAIALTKQKPEFVELVREEAGRIVAREQEKQARRSGPAGQISMFEEE